MSFLTLAKERYSVRKFADKKVEQEKIALILKAGHYAPTACNNQPQKIYVIQSEEALARLKTVTRCHFDAPLAMLICYDKNLSWNRKYDGKDSGDIDASIVTTHMMLQAYELGIGSTWVMHYDPVKAREIFSLSENLESTAILVMGYPAEDAVPLNLHDTYKDQAEIVTVL